MDIAWPWMPKIIILLSLVQIARNEIQNDMLNTHSNNETQIALQIALDNISLFWF